MLKSIRKVNTVVILAIASALIIVVASFFPWTSLWLVLIIGYVGYCLNLFGAWILLLWAYKKGIAQKPPHASSLKWAKVVAITLPVVILISSIMMPILEIPVMAPIIMTGFICMGGLGGYLASGGVFANLEME